MTYDLHKPCGNCPFRNDRAGYLNPARVTEIGEALVRSEFPCHKTTVSTDDGQSAVTPESKHCAGALILLEKTNRPSQMMRISERFGMYDRRKLDMDAPVFDSFAEMRNAQPK